MTARLDDTALDMALDGGRALIEASAGSGKTRAITTLVARLAVEQGRALDSILIVTFTKAATAELRARVRKIFGEIRRELENPGDSGDKGDEQARELLAKWADIENLDKQRIRNRIEAALLDIDRANVFTIHGFCQRALAEFAFETGFPFSFEVVGDGAVIVESVVRDLWQRHFGDCSPTFADYLLTPKQKFLPAELAQWFGSIRAKRFAEIRGGSCSPDAPGKAEIACRATLAFLLSSWRKHGGEYRRILRESTAFDRRGFNKASIEKHLASATEFLAAGVLPINIDDLKKLEQAARFLGAANASQKCKAGCQLPENPLFEAFDEMADACTGLLKNFDDWLRRVRRLIIAAADGEIRRIAREERRLGFDDLLIEMRDALGRGDAGRRLAAHLRQRFPVALIDEFQDTDPTQARIFDSIYGGSATARGGESSGQSDCQGALYIVGDPKQSIYEFRGADIFAYLAARKNSDTISRLGRNWRSAPALVAAVNAIFDVPLAFAIPEIRFEPARAGRDSEKRLVIDGESPPPFAFWLPEDQPNNDQARALAANATANDIVRLLRLARAGKAAIKGKPLRAADIAVLTHTRAQGREIAAALRARGAKSVEIDDASVFATREAGQVHRLLRALANPGRQDLLRAALADDIFGLDNARLLALNEQDEAWVDWSLRSSEWRESWRTRGVGAMLRGIVDADGGAGNLLRYADGPRRITNLYHLTELLQEAETEHRFSPAGLLAWLARRMAGRSGTGEGEAEAAALRLDSDEDLVKIRTIHKSKGLEFPIVYLPFAWYCRQLGKRPATSVSYHRRDGAEFQTVLDLAPDQSSRRMRELEEFGESIRLLYVALTRARERCVVVWNRIESRGEKELPPLAWLMHRNKQYARLLAELGGGPSASSASAAAVSSAHAELRADFRDKGRDIFLAEVRAVADKCPQGIEIVEIADDSAAPAARADAKQAPELKLECRDFDRSLRRIRQLTSFTALAANHAAPAPMHRFMEAGEPDRDEAADAMDIDVDAGAAAKQTGQINTFNFPRGIHVGTCLHQIFEILDQEPEREIDQLCEEQLERAGIEVKWRGVARAMVENTRATELREPGRDGFRLAAIDRRLVELEFCFPVNGLRGAGLGATLARFGYPGLLDGHRDAPPIDGYLRGFIDLAFVREGRWYVLDYKSNWLGDNARDYARERLAAAMSEHRYQLQYLIYLLALHRYLRTRLPDYDYERHIGGAFYLFLRGMDPAAGMTRGVWFDRPSRQCIEALDDCMRGAS